MMESAGARATMPRQLTEPKELAQALEGQSQVVFDLDGTVYDPRDFERPALAAVVAWVRKLSGRALPGATETLWSRREQDRHRHGLFDEWLEQERLPVSWGRECRQRFHAHPGEELRTSASLKPLLESLRDSGTKLALVSNGYPEVQRRKLDCLGVADLFGACVLCDPAMPERLKPSAWAWTQLGDWRDNGAVVYVGDDPVDAEFAAAGGTRFVSFRFRNPSHAD
jgi:FMN phosphatase YigB (HAD superfamily)